MTEAERYERAVAAWYAARSSAQLAAADALCRRLEEDLRKKEKHVGLG